MHLLRGSLLETFVIAELLKAWLNAGERACDPLLIYGGDQSYLHKGIQVLCWRDLAQPALTRWAVGP